MAGEFLDVKPGDPITAEIWNRLLAATDRSNVLYGGENIRVTKLPHGTIVNAKNTMGWLHPWKVIAAKKTATVLPGLINGEEPTMIDKKTGQPKKLSDRPPPQLSINERSLGANGIGWIALELETDEKYRAIKTAEVVQCQVITLSEEKTANPYFYFGLGGIGNFRVRYPLARLQKAINGISVYQVAMFNLNWAAKPPAPSGTGTARQAGQSALPRHFFWPS